MIEGCIFLFGQGTGPRAPLQIVVEFLLKDMDIPLGIILGRDASWGRK